MSFLYFYFFFAFFYFPAVPQRRPVFLDHGQGEKMPMARVWRENHIIVIIFFSFFLSWAISDICFSPRSVLPLPSCGFKHLRENLCLWIKESEKGPWLCKKYEEIVLLLVDWFNGWMNIFLSLFCPKYSLNHEELWDSIKC